MPLFTRETAAIMGKKGALVRWTPQEPPASPPPLPANGDPEIAAQTRAQIVAIDSRLARAATMDAETLDLLTRAKERLWKVLAHAAQIPQPAHVKQERRRRQDAIDLEPMPIVALSDMPSESGQPLPPGQAEKESLPQG